MSGGGGSSSDSGGGGGPPGGGDKGMYSTKASRTQPTARDIAMGGGTSSSPTKYVSKPKATKTYVTSPGGGRDSGAKPKVIVPKKKPIQVSSDDEYDVPDKDHYRQTQKDIATTNKELAKNDQTDIKMSKEQYDLFNKNLNEYYGTENVKYEPYGRAGKGTVNLSFNEHYNNVITQNPALKFSPTLAFLTAAGRNVNEYLTSDYGTYKYAGPGTDSGGLLGSGKRTQQQTERQLMSNVAPDAPYIVSGLDKPDSSPAADFFAKINKNKNELFFQDQYDSAKAKMQGILGSPSPMRYLAISESPFYGWLKKNNLDKGIL
jgi:hypothetical protein